MSSSRDGPVTFCVGTGRCGTTFITELLGREPTVAASHERLRVAACFHMFCKWHGIPIDPEGFLQDRDRLVADDLAEHAASFEASALVSHSVAELHERFDARFILLARAPAASVSSFAVRGWFLEPIAWKDRSRPPSMPDAANPRHFFGRNLPRGEEAFDRWSALHQLGKLGWFWAARIGAIVEQLAELPASHAMILRLEDFDHATYQRVARFVGVEPTVDAQTFGALAGRRLNTGPNPPLTLPQWPEEGVAQYEAEVGALASALGYEHRIEALRAGAAPIVGPHGAPADVLARLQSL